MKYNIGRLAIALLYQLKELKLAEDGWTTKVTQAEAVEAQARLIAMYGPHELLPERRALLEEAVLNFNVSAALREFFETHPETAGSDPLALTPERLAEEITGQLPLSAAPKEEGKQSTFPLVPVPYSEFAPETNNPAYPESRMVGLTKMKTLQEGEDSLTYRVRASNSVHSWFSSLTTEIRGELLQSLMLTNPKVSPTKEAAAPPAAPSVPSDWEAEVKEQMDVYGLPESMTPEELAYFSARGRKVLALAHGYWPEVMNNSSAEHLLDELKQLVPHVWAAKAAKKRVDDSQQVPEDSGADVDQSLKGLPAVHNLLAYINNDGGITEKVVGLEDAAYIALKRLERAERRPNEEG